MRIFPTSSRSAVVARARFHRRASRHAPFLALLLVAGQLLANFTNPRDYGSRAQMVRGIVAGPRGATRPFGMSPWQYACFKRACLKAKASPSRVVQTIGNARLSAGFHAQDGIAREGQDFYPYSAATDLRTRDLSRPQIRALLSALYDAGFVAWYRYQGTFKVCQHIHMVFAGLPMKPQLRRQIADGVAGRTGLVGHRVESFYRPTAAQTARLRALYRRCSLAPAGAPHDGEGE